MKMPRKFHLYGLISCFLAAGFTTCVVVTLFALTPNSAQAQDRFAAPDAAYKRKDYATAYRLWLGLADEGNASACFNLGRLYLFGEGVPIDLIEAYKWFVLADQGGLPVAKAGLVRLGPMMTPSDIREARVRIESWLNQHPNLPRRGPNR